MSSDSSTPSNGLDVSFVLSWTESARIMQRPDCHDGSRFPHEEFVLAGRGTFRFMRQVEDCLASEISRAKPEPTMLRSMTAFARIESQHDLGGVQWEIRSVNHRYLDVNVRLPEDLRRIEPKVRERVGTHLKRGKVDCTLRVLPAPAAAGGLSVDRDLAARVAHAARSVAELLPEPAPVSPVDILRWPGVVQAQAPDPELIERFVLEALDHALSDLVAMREREGARIATMIRERLDDLEVETGRVREVLPAIVQGYGERMRARIEELDATVDEGRIEQELALVAQRMDVAEELDRLEAHVDEIRATLENPRPAGRRLDFLMQELNREANTLGSKSAAVTTSRASVDLKVLIEQMREQIQNVE